MVRAFNPWRRLGAGRAGAAPYLTEESSDETTFSPGRDYLRERGFPVLTQTNRILAITTRTIDKTTVVVGSAVDGPAETAPRRAKKIVGKDHRSDLVVGTEYRDVSRKYLIVETEGPEVIQLTDISSLGTSIPHEYLDATAP